jgi:methyltransferase (TIGR00027 family)
MVPLRLEFGGHCQRKKAMGKNNTQSRIINQPSHTALMAAIHRFLASKESRRGFKGPDHFAYLFLPAKAKFFLSFSFFRKIFSKKLHNKVPGSYEYITARTKFIDEIFLRAVEENIPQIIFLGAGYDTRSIRFREQIQQTVIFEVDAPTTQEEKKNIIKKYEVHLPLKITFVAMNFDVDGLKAALSLAAMIQPKRVFSFGKV